MDNKSRSLVKQFSFPVSLAYSNGLQRNSVYEESVELDVRTDTPTCGVSFPTNPIEPFVIAAVERLGTQIDLQMLLEPGQVRQPGTDKKRKRIEYSEMEARIV